MTLLALTELKAALGITDTNDDALIEYAIRAAETWAEAYCGRTFAIDAADVQQVYDPSQDNLIRVVDLQTVTTIKIDEDGDRSYSRTLATTDYDLRPLDGPPYSEVRIWPLSSYAFVPGQLVKITGKFGYGSVPYDVKQALILQASRLFKRREAPFGVLGTTDIGVYQRLSEMDPDVKLLLDPYRASSVWVVV